MKHSEETSGARHLAAVKKRIEVVSAAICAQMYCDTVDEALLLAGTSLMRHEVHTITLAEERAELAFLKLRQTQLEAAARVTP